jgi:cytoskeletal protein CcmA (bactofilin family)
VSAGGAAPIPLVGPGARFEGTLAFRGQAWVEGEVTGQVLARGTLHVAPGAVVRARVEAEEVVVAGTVEGEVTASRRLAVLAGGRIQGDVRTPSLVLADGAHLDGRCEMLSGLSPRAGKR